MAGSGRRTGWWIVGGLAVVALAAALLTRPLGAPSPDAGIEEHEAWRAQRREANARPRPEPTSLRGARPSWTVPSDWPRADPEPTSARVEFDEYLRAEAELPNDSSDGGGRAWIEPNEDGTIDWAEAGGRGRWTIVYEAGAAGVAVGGSVFLIASSYWDWSWPQTERPDLPGFTHVSTPAEGVELRTSMPVEQHLQVKIGGRALSPGERIRFVYGAGPEGAAVDRYAEAGEWIWVAVDGDGDGWPAVLPDSPRVPIVPGRVDLVALSLPTTARAGDDVELVVALLDRMGNAGIPLEGVLELTPPPDGLSYDPRVELRAEDLGRARVPIRVEREGVFRVATRAIEVAEQRAELAIESNPLVVDPDAPRVLWADLHGHSGISDGTGTPDDYFDYARHVAGLDIVSLTDHDHYGRRHLDGSPDLWREIREATRRHHAPGAFVTILGYEWTSWIHGHRHVLYFADDGPVFSSLDPRVRTPEQLWERLRGLPAMTFAHHSAGGPVATNWTYAPDPLLEPLTEVSSVHGVSEAWDAPAPELLYSPERGNFVRDVLDDGAVLGFVGSGDSHDGHPGLAQIAGFGKGGLAAVLCEEHDRDAVRASLTERRTYATNGARIFLDVLLAGHEQGRIVTPAQLGDRPALAVRVVGTGELRELHVIRSGEVVETRELDGALDAALSIPLDDLAVGEYVYVRVLQTDRGLAWSSPIFVR